MVKHRKHVCTSSAKISGGRMTVRASCPTKAGKSCKAGRPAKAKRHYKHTDVPPQCKGLKKSKRKACAKRVCSLRPEPYRTQCKKAAGVR